MLDKSSLTGCTALVTGASGGLGRAFVENLLERGASTVWAAGRTLPSGFPSAVQPLTLDVTDRSSVLAAVAQFDKLDLLVNNAGINTRASLLAGDVDDIAREFDTNVFGPLWLTRACAPLLARSSHGAVLTVLSALSWMSSPSEPAYAAAKTASWGVTNGLRLELAAQRTRVTALHMGTTRTPMAGTYAGPMNEPADVAEAGLDGVERGLDEVIVDDFTRAAKATLR